MRYFIFRNYTLEPFFKYLDAGFSGYEDISHIDEQSHTYIWFYFPPFYPNKAQAAQQIQNYSKQAELVFSKIPETKTIIAISMIEYFSIQYEISDCSLKQAIDEYNTALYQLSDKYVNVKLLDISSFFRQTSLAENIDWKYYFLAQIPLNPQLVNSFSSWFARQLEILEFNRKKCLVLDLDNTLWGGILGEDGIHGIKIGGDYPGNAFLFFQQCISELSEKGIILAVCSKNNETDVLDAWNKNPFLLLKEQHFATWQINWNDKVSNLKKIAVDLNIGLDSIVFLDDNPRERELVKQLLPSVETPDFPEQAYMLPSFFSQLVDKYFSVYQLTTGDVQKTQQYKANVERKKHEESFADMESYLKSLEIEIEFQQADSFNIPRIAQMTQKTNQFNLTTKRYTEADIYEFIENGYLIFCFEIKDKFGNSGISGTIIASKNRDIIKIDSFLLSCRILGKGIENAVFNYFLQKMKDSGITQVFSTYIPTQKNQQVSTFYDDIGFEKTNEIELEKNYKLDLNIYTPIIPTYYKIK
jgi:FkbH-like protein